mmetsp:Transcript_1508/g.2017  ORF Transcript_1508/g.2017 Transcript_1508/m.2017 type:complete len:104 (-) Transcript_1508:4389-4700(-)
MQLEVLGILGVQKPVHLRNRVTIDDFVYNGVKPWIISKEDQVTHMTNLNALRLLQNTSSESHFEINALRERDVMSQLEKALKNLADRMAKKSTSADDDFESLS